MARLRLRNCLNLAGDKAASSTATHWVMSICGSAVKSLAAVRTPTRCRLVIAAPKVEGNHGSNLLEIAIKGHCYLQPNPRRRCELMELCGKLTPDVGSTLLVQTIALAQVILGPLLQVMLICDVLILNMNGNEFR